MDTVKAGASVGTAYEFKSCWELPDKDELHKNGELFFKSPFYLHNHLHIGLVIPPEERNIESGWMLHAEIVVAGGNCCHGFVMVVISSGSLRHAVEVDLNVFFLIPIVYEVYSLREKGKKWTCIGLLISGAGCSGSGIRFLKMENVPETITLVNGFEEDVWDYDSWFKRHPLKYPRIWELLEESGISVKREETETAIATWQLVDQAYRGAG